MLAIVGEAWGEEEERTGVPFFGKAGQELTRMLREAGIDRASCFITNVFNTRPPNNDLTSFCCPKRDASLSYAERYRAELVASHPLYAWPERYDWPPLAGPGKFLHPAYLSHLAELKARLTAINPSLILALGNTACWGLLGRTGIGKLRGYIYQSPLLAGLQVLPTYHPASILRQWANRPIAVADLSKAARQLRLGQDRAGEAEPSNSSTAGSRSRQRVLWIEPTLEDLERWWGQEVLSDTTPVSVDIETFGGAITCIGFGVARGAISVPFWDRRAEGNSYWWDVGEEEKALSWVRGKLLSPNPKIFQNGLYDLQYIWQTWGFTVAGRIEDTMLIHHALQPEMSKDLGFLGATYTNEIAWKSLRKQAHMKAKAEKKDE